RLQGLVLREHPDQDRDQKRAEDDARTEDRQQPRAGGRWIGAAKIAADRLSGGSYQRQTRCFHENQDERREEFLLSSSSSRPSSSAAAGAADGLEERREAAQTNNDDH